MMVKIEIANKYGKFWLDENRIFNFKYHPGAVIDLEAAKFLAKERIKLYNGQRYPFLIDTTGLKYLSAAASKYFSSEESTILIPAGAFLIGSFLSKVFGNFYLKVYPPSAPTKLFTDREEAIKWLSKYQ